LAKNPNPKLPIETVPGIIGGVSALASAHAPFLYFDGAPNFGWNAGVINVTLEAARFHSTLDGVFADRVSVAHLRMNIPAAVALRDALNGALLLAQPSKSEAKN